MGYFATSGDPGFEVWQVFNDHPDESYHERHQSNSVESTNAALKQIFPLQLRYEAFEGQFNDLRCKLNAYELVAVALQTRMRRTVPDFPPDVHPT